MVSIRLFIVKFSFMYFPKKQKVDLTSRGYLKKLQNAPEKSNFATFKVKPFINQYFVQWARHNSDCNVSEWQFESPVGVPGPLVHVFKKLPQPCRY